jgi:phospholipase/carboxylesterase
MIHGYGSHEEDLFSFATELPENMIIVSVRAPYDTGFGGFAWYSINFDADQSRFSDLNQAKSSMMLLADFIDEMKIKYQIEASNTFLLGFSQGTILSYALALSFPNKVHNIIALSGYVIPELLPLAMSEKDFSKLDFYISHGSVDQVIPVQWGKKATAILEEYNIRHCYTEYPVGHGVSPQNFHAFKQWIADRS